MWVFSILFIRSRGPAGVVVTSHLSVPLSMLQGYVVIQMDFGFPHHLLVEFLKKTLQ